MRVLVAGGSGFLGSHVADAFSQAGHAVTVLDIAPSPWLRDDQRQVVADLLDERAVADAAEGQEVVCNFAGVADIAACEADPLGSARVNVLGNLHLLDAARAAGAKRYLFASTIYVYSESGGVYRVTKQASELYVEEYQRRHGLPFTILRYGTLYGPRANAFNSVRRYLRDALVDRKIVAAGPGDAIREYIHVQDAARLTVRAAGQEFVNERVILTGHQPMHFEDLLTMASEIVGGAQVEILPPDPSPGGHYKITPYTFRPKKALKLVSDYYTDLGQGLLECLEEIHAAEGGQTGGTA